MTLIDYARVFDAIASPYMLLDRDLRFVAANKAYLQTTGRRMDELRGQYVMDAFPNPGEGGRRLEASLKKVAHSGDADTLAYLPYPIPRGDGTFEHRYWTAVHTPVFDDEGRVAFILQNTVDVTEYARLREQATLPFTSLSAETSLIERTREAEAASADFRRLFQQAPAFFAVLSGPDHIFTFASDSYIALIGGRTVIGRPLREALPEVVEQGLVDALDRVFREGVAHSAEGARLLLETRAGQGPEEHFLDLSYQPIRAPDGRVAGVFVQGMDRTESVRAQQRQRLLIDELNHRVKNTLASVQSIAALTLRAASDVTEARRAFQDRIAALSNAHNVLSARQWHDAEIETILRQALAAYDAAQVRIGGPGLVINAKTTVALALLFHELASNAAKHGALSTPSGTLSVAWRNGGVGDLMVDWVERGGPEASPPARKGLGTRMLEAVVAGELGGTLEAEYGQAGFSARLCIPATAYKGEREDG